MEVRCPGCDRARVSMQLGVVSECHPQRSGRGFGASRKRSGTTQNFRHSLSHLKLSLGRVLAERPHDGAELLSGDGAIAILVEQGEGLLELGDLL